MAGRIPQDFIDDLIARTDIVEVIGRRVPLKKAGREFKACCPFHDEKTPSFTVSPAKGFYHCFGCGAHGTAVGFLMDFDHMDFVEAVEALANTMGVEVPRDQTDRPARRYDELFELLANVEQLWRNRLKESPAAVEYLKQRGVDGATARRFGIGYAPEGWSTVLDRYGKSPEAIERLLAAGLVIRKDNGRHYDRFRDRIVFPIRDTRGRCIGFGGRAMGDGEPKYLNSPETVLFHKGRELYGLYEARQALRQIERIVVVEGYMDVVALAQHGIHFSVATLGTATTAEHLNRLFRLTDDVSFCFDGDRAGRQAAWRALENALPLIREGRQIHFVFLPDGHDPDSYVNAQGTDAFLELLDTGTALSDYLIGELAGQVELDTVDGRARLIELAKPFIAKTQTASHRLVLVDSLAETVGLSAEKLDSTLGTPRSEDAARTGRSSGPLARRVQHIANVPSVVRRAIKLLLHSPQIAVRFDVDKLAGIDRPGVELLRNLIETVQTEPNITTAGVLEHWRHNAEGRHLGKLAAQDIPNDDEFDAGAEFAECLNTLTRMGRRKYFRKRIKEQPVSEWSDEDRAEFKQPR